jgi:dTDP-4-dehydrorhamnose reductase
MRLLVMILGAGGQLGEAMTDGLAKGHEVISKTRAELDLTSAAAVKEAIATTMPDVVVNCSAYTNVDAAQTAPQQAIAVNSWAVRSVARAAAEIDAVFVHYSTDFVFDGVASEPYTEEAAPNPRGTYAVSKLLGEWFAAETPKHYVLRVESLFGGPRAKSSVDALLDGIRNGRPVKAFADRTVSPSYVEDVVHATRELIEHRPAYGLYHCVNSGYATWVDVARELARLAGRPEAVIEGVQMASLSLPTPRPLFAALSNAKLTKAGIPMATWQDALARYVSQSARPA